MICRHRASLAVVCYDTFVTHQVQHKTKTWHQKRYKTSGVKNITNFFFLSSFLQPVTVGRGYVSRWLVTVSALQGLCNQSAPSVNPRHLAATLWWGVRSATALTLASCPPMWAAIHSADSAGMRRRDRGNNDKLLLTRLKKHCVWLRIAPFLLVKNQVNLLWSGFDLADTSFSHLGSAQLLMLT